MATPEEKAVLDFIAKGEGGYESMNEGTSGGKIIGSTDDAYAKLGKRIQDMTFDELAQLQQEGKLFAFGRYQITPNTLPDALAAAGLSGSDVATAENQDKAGLGLLTNKRGRGKLNAFMNGESDDVEGAMSDLAKEWASIPDPTTGESYYKDSGNKASHTVDDVRNTLLEFQRARRESSQDPVASFVDTGLPQDPVAQFTTTPVPDRTPEQRRNERARAAYTATSLGSPVLVADGDAAYQSPGRRIPARSRSTPTDLRDAARLAAEQSQATGLFADVIAKEAQSAAATPNVVAAPANMGEAFERGFSAGLYGTESDYTYLKAAAETLFGMNKNAETTIGNARLFEDDAASVQEGSETFSSFLSAPTFGGFLEQMATAGGQVAPSVMATVASAMVSGGTGAVASVGGKVAAERGGTAIAKSLIKDSVARKFKGEQLDEVEQVLVEALCNEYRREYFNAAGKGFKQGAAVGAFGQEYTQMTGGSFAELDEAGVPLDAGRAVEAFLVGVPLAAVGVGGEAVIADNIFSLMRKRALQQPNSVFADVLKDVAKNTGKSSLTEGLTEAAQESILVAQRREADPDYSYEEGQLRIGQAAFAGALAGGAVGGAGSTVTGAVRLARDGAPKAVQAGRDFVDDHPELVSKAKEGLSEADTNMRAVFNLSKKMLAAKAADVKAAMGGKPSTNPEDLAQPVPEPEADIRAQFAQVLNPDSGKKSVWIPENAPADIKKASENPDQIVKTDNGYAAYIAGKGTIWSPDIELVNAVLEAEASDESLAAALGYSGTKPADADRVVRVVRKSDGAVLHEELTNAAGVEAAVEAANKVKTDGDLVDVMPWEKAMDWRRKRTEETSKNEPKEMSQKFENVKGTPDYMQLEEEVASDKPFSKADEIGDYKIPAERVYMPEIDDLFQWIYENSGENTAFSEETFNALVPFYDKISTSLARRILEMIETGTHEPILRETGDGYLTLYATPKDAMGETYWQQREQERLKQQLISLATENAYEPSRIRVRSKTDGGVVSPNIAAIVAGAVKLNFLTGEALIGENMTRQQVARAGLIRAMKELAAAKLEIGYAVTPESDSTKSEGFKALTMSKRDLRDSGIADIVIYGKKTRPVTLGEAISSPDPRPLENDVADARMATAHARELRIIEANDKKLRREMRKDRKKLIDKMMRDGVSEAKIDEFIQNWDKQQAAFIEDTMNNKIAQAMMRLDKQNKSDNFDPSDIEDVTTDLTDTGDSDASAQDEAFKSPDYAGERLDRVLEDPTETRTVKVWEEEGEVMKKRRKKVPVSPKSVAERNLRMLEERRERLRNLRDDLVEEFKAADKPSPELREQILALGKNIGAIEREMDGIESAYDFYTPGPGEQPLNLRFTQQGGLKGTASRIITETPGARVAPELRELDSHPRSQRLEAVRKANMDNVVILGKDLAAPIRRVIGIAKKHFKIAEPLTVMSYTDMVANFDYMFGDRRESQQAQEAAAQLAKMDGDNPIAGVLIPGRTHLIILNDRIYPNERLRDHGMAMVLAHELGHIVYSQELNNLTLPENEALFKKLKGAFAMSVQEREAGVASLPAVPEGYTRLYRLEGKGFTTNVVDLMRAFASSEGTPRVYYIDIKTDAVERVKRKSDGTVALPEAIASRAKRAKPTPVDQYTLDNFGFEEWYADQVAAAIAKIASRPTEGLKMRITKNGNERVAYNVSTQTREYFREIAQKFKAFFKAINIAFRDRFTQDDTFEKYINGVIQSRKDEWSMGKVPPRADINAIKNMVDKMSKSDKDVKLAIELKNGTARVIQGNPSDLKKWLGRHLTAADDWLRARGEPGVKIAQFFYNKSQSKEVTGFHTSKDFARNRLINRLGSALGGKVTEKDLMKGAIRDAMLRAEDDTVDTANLDPMARKIREVFEYIDQHYITDKDGRRLLKFKPRKNYFHRIINGQAVRANPEGFVDFLKENGVDEKGALKVTKKILRLDIPPGELTLERIMAEVGVAMTAEETAALLDEANSDGYKPAAAATRRRGLSHIPTKTMRQDTKRGDKEYGWLVHPSQAMLLYFHHITKLVEFERRGGLIEEMNPITKQMETKMVYGKRYLDYLLDQLPPEDRDHARMAIKANLGQLGHERIKIFGKDITDAAHTANSIAATHTVMTTLLFSVFASLPDFAAVALRNKEAKNLGDVFRQFKNTLTDKENAELARAIGVVTHEVIDNAFMSAGEMDFVQRPFKKAMAAFFKWTGTEAYTKMMRTFAVGMGREFMLTTANDPDFGPRQQRYLEELGVTRERVQAWDKAGRPTTDAFSDVLEGIGRFADEAILRPNAAQRPIWASNPWFLAVWQLKSYFYAYGKTVMGGLIREIKNRNAENGGNVNESVVLVLLAAGLIAPLTMIGLEAREYTKWWGRYINPFQDADNSVFQTNYMDPAEYALEIVDRSGIFGAYGLALSTYKGIEREGLVGGPIISNVPILDAFDDSVNDKDYGRLLPVINNL